MELPESHLKDCQFIPLVACTSTLTGSGGGGGPSRNTRVIQALLKWLTEWDEEEKPCLATVYGQQFLYPEISWPIL